MVPLFPWKPLLLFLSLFFYEHWISIPSCNIVPNSNLNRQENDVVEEEHDNNEVLKVMLVANLLLLGSDTSFFNLYFRDHYMSKVFKKSFYSLKPDMLLVMGDVSARGSTLTRGKWVSVLHQFHGMLGPFIELPFHVFVIWSRSFPGLDSSGCGGFDIDNVSFVSLNAVALLCGSNKLRFSVEKAVEMERIDSWMDTEKEMDDYGEFTKISDSFGPRKDSVSSGLGPVLLLHFPLHRAADNGGCKEGNIVRKALSLRQNLNALESSRWGFTGAPYELSHTIPPNATQYIFQALKPRYFYKSLFMLITVPAMTWKARDDPGFVFATFRSGGNTVFWINIPEF
ncbi:metallophosphoesterase [Salix suchowensis]|nr:metallophosphoesterase [Salix suchowensis]